jgi:hypothetical protein
VTFAVAHARPRALGPQGPLVGGMAHAPLTHSRPVAHPVTVKAALNSVQAPLISFVRRHVPGVTVPPPRTP